MFGLIWPIRGKASEMDGRWNYHNKRRRRGGNDWCRPSIRKDHRVVCTWVKCAPPVPSLEEEAARPFVHGPVNPRDVTSSCRENSLVSKRSASYAQYTSFHQSRGSRHLFTYFCFFFSIYFCAIFFFSGGQRRCWQKHKVLGISRECDDWRTGHVAEVAAELAFSLWPSTPSIVTMDRLLNWHERLIKSLTKRPAQPFLLKLSTCNSIRGQVAANGSFLCHRIR